MFSKQITLLLSPATQSVKCYVLRYIHIRVQFVEGVKNGFDAFGCVLHQGPKTIINTLLYLLNEAGTIYNTVRYWRAERDYRGDILDRDRSSILSAGPLAVTDGATMWSPPDPQIDLCVRQGPTAAAFGAP